MFNNKVLLYSVLEEKISNAQTLLENIKNYPLVDDDSPATSYNNVIAALIEIEKAENEYAQALLATLPSNAKNCIIKLKNNSEGITTTEALEQYRTKRAKTTNGFLIAGLVESIAGIFAAFSQSKENFSSTQFYIGDALFLLGAAQFIPAAFEYVRERKPADIAAEKSSVLAQLQQLKASLLETRASLRDLAYSQDESSAEIADEAYASTLHLLSNPTKEDREI